MIKSSIKIQIKKLKLQGITVSQEAPDGKRNRCMPKKRGFLAPKIKLSQMLLSPWTDLFLSAACWEHTCWFCPGPSGTLRLQLVAARHITDPQLIICKRYFPYILQTPYLGSLAVSVSLGEHSPPQNGCGPIEWNLSLKVYLSFSFRPWFYGIHIFF